MKKLIPTILALVLIVACVIVSVIFLTKPDFIKSSSDVISYVSNPDAVSFSKLINESNAILTASVIKSSTSGETTVYTL